uniref:BRCT domain-containing protein n=1 Tax=Aegilops tauschii subsp. strangulata TaxID=200361 RepID=A0A452YZM5_AEGTS
AHRTLSWCPLSSYQILWWQVQIISKLDEIDEPSKTIFLACEEGMELAMDAAKRGIKTFSSEWLMTCVMRQEVDLDAPPFAESL